MKKIIVLVLGLGAVGGGGLRAAEPAPKKVELPHPFYWAAPDAWRGDWAGEGGFVAQVIRAGDKVLSIQDLIPQEADEGKYEAHVFRQFDVANDTPLAVLHGVRSGETVTFDDAGWTGAIAGGHFKAHHGADAFDLRHVTRTPPTLGAKPPAGAVVLFDGKNMNAWGRRTGPDWLKEDGAPPWHLVDGDAMEVVPNSGYLLTHQWLGDYHLHLEFRTLGGPTNSGVYLETRYETNINEMYGRLDGNACAQFDNCTEKVSNPGIRCSRPPFEWQTMDIDFHPPRFEAGKKTASARATLVFNGVPFYTDQPIGPPKLNAAKLGEAPTGPIMLQDHGMPVQFRNIWLIEKTP